MKLLDIIDERAIVPSLNASDRDGVIAELVDALIAAGHAAPDQRDELIEKVLAREERGSTGFGKGVAVPHVKLEGAERVAAAVGVSEQGVDFNALDKEPVFAFILLLSPAEQPDEHLKAMEVIFGNLSQNNFRRFLHQARSADDVLTLLKDADNHQLPV
jgi:mannitol/fructose-specific phosphotransferase system IIA component (Ntr-type)